MSERICQSCGMPLRKLADFGTDEEGNKNDEFCCFCFQLGKYVDSGITLKEKIDKNVEIAKEMGIPEDKARERTKKVLPKLKRWKK